MKYTYSVFLLLLYSLSLRAQDPREGPGFFSDPRVTPLGTVCTNNYASAIYIIRDGTPQELVSVPGCGNYYTLSYDNRRIGLKLVSADGGQTPAILDLQSGTVKTLITPASQVGQVSFARDGKIAFTQGEKLIVLDGESEKAYSLGGYANLAPISPDAKRVVYNDRDDRIWLLDLETGRRLEISDGRMGYFDPIWSPGGTRVLYSSLNGTMRVYELETKQIHDLGEGFHPSWSQDSRRIVFYRKEFRGFQLVNTDLYVSSFDGTGLQRLTTSTDVMEMDPSFLEDDSGIVFHTRENRTIVTAMIADGQMTIQKSTPLREIALPGPERFNLMPDHGLPAIKSTSQLDIPYVHQRYDTPDWFNGDWACAPTQAIMLLAYFNILPKWPTPCSSPSFHYNEWGNYVSGIYQFRQVTYSDQADDAGGKPASGGYGYMWTGSYHPYTRMADYFRNHGISATQTDATPYSTAFAEVNAGHPLSMCVMLTSSGHLVLAHDIGAEPHTFVFNDPYGDKNRGYMNYYGKNVRYDWPGYNNGYQNLTGVAWCIATRYTPLAASDTIVDDLQFDHGFTMQTTAPSSMALWKDANSGYLDHAWYTYTRRGGADTCYAVWTPTITEDGVYEVTAFIPFIGAASGAEYRITHSNGITTKIISQYNNVGTWASLGSYTFTRSSGGSVRLGDASTSPGQVIAFDAVRWSKKGILSGIAQEATRVPRAFALEQNYPNPFNPATNFGFRIAEFGFVSLKVFDMLGREVATLVNDVRQPGVYSVQWDASSFPSGVYFYRLEVRPTDGGQAQGASTSSAQGFVETKRMTLIK